MFEEITATISAIVIALGGYGLTEPGCVQSLSTPGYFLCWEKGSDNYRNGTSWMGTFDGRLVYRDGVSKRPEEHQVKTLIAWKTLAKRAQKRREQQGWEPKSSKF